MKQPKRGDILQPGRKTVLTYLTPSLIIYLLVFILPIFLVIVMSFFKFSSIKRFTFIGLANYKALFMDSNIPRALLNNLVLIGSCLIGQLGIAYLLACILNSKRIRLANVSRTLIYFPVTLSAIVIGYVWQFVYDYNFGLVTYFLNAIGRSDMVTPLLGRVDTVMLCICIPLIWQYVGFHLVIMMSAMSSINKEVLEVAEIDGCNGLQKSIYIILPLIKPTLVICVFLCISANMKVFDHIMTMTNGGPGVASNVLALYAYNVSFKQMNMGYGSAISVFILVITTILFILSRVPAIIGRRKESEI